MSDFRVECPECGAVLEFRRPLNIDDRCPSCDRALISAKYHAGIPTGIVAGLIGGAVGLVALMSMIWLMNAPLPQQVSAQFPVATPNASPKPVAPMEPARPVFLDVEGQTAEIAEETDPVAPANPLQYSFLNSDEFQYRYQLKATLEDREETTSGTVSYSVVDRDKKRMVVHKKRAGSGTAFVISSDGLLVTCAHVVDGADAIEVVLNEITYQAEVIASDSTTDLAVLKIPATDLTALPVDDSQNVELGQDIRVAGYPLSDVLGESIKVSTGTISGVILRDGNRLFQVDAAVNPGNSGGPVINEAGTVIGVACAKLSGVDISRVGFCVPSNALSALLDQHKLNANGIHKQAEQNGPALIKMISPAVAFVKVKTAPNHGTHTVLRFSGHSTKTFKDARGLTMPVFDARLRMPNFGRGEISIMRTGELVRSSDEPQLPYLLGPPSQLTIFKLPASPKATWSERRETSVVWERDQGSNMYRRLSPFGRERGEIVDVQPAVETSQYKITKQDEHKTVIERTYDFHTTDLGKKSYKMIGTGTITFDHAGGVVSEYVFNGNYILETDELSVTIPLELTANLTSSRVATQPDQNAIPPRDQMANRPQPIEASKDVELLDVPVKLKISGLNWGVTSLAFTPDDRFLLAGKLDHYLEVYDAESGRKVFSEGPLKELKQVTCLAVSADGKHVVAGGSSGMIRVWDLAENGLLTPVAILEGHTQTIKQLRFSLDDQFLISGSSDKSLRCWAMQDHSEVYAVTDFKRDVRAVHLFEKGKLLASDGTLLKTIDLATGAVSNTIELTSAGTPQQVGFSPDGTVVVASEGYSLKRWETETGQELPEYKGKEILWDFTFNQAGSLIVGGGRGHLALWDNEQPNLKGHIALDDSIFYVKPVALSHNGKYLACYPSAAGQSIYLFELPSD